MDYIMRDLLVKSNYDVVIISRYNPWEGGGLENMVQKQVTSLLDAGLRVAVFFRKRAKKEKLPHEVTCYTVNDFLSRFSGALADIIYAVPTYLKVAKIDTKVVLDNFELPFLYIIFKKPKKHVKIIKVHHGTPNYLTSYKGYKGVLAKIYMLFLKPFYSMSSKKVDLNIAVSHKIKKELIIDYRVPKEKIIVILNGVDIDRFIPRNKLLIRKQLKIPLKKKIVMFLGGDYERKGLHEALNIIELLRNNNSNIMLLVISSKEVKNDRKWVKVFHSVSNHQLPLLYNISDIFLLPSKYEVGLPLAAIESISSGCPVVLSTVAAEEGNIGEGYLVAHNFSQYIAFCRELIENEGYWNEMSLSGRALAIRKYNEEEQFASYLENITTIASINKKLKSNNSDYSETIKNSIN